MDNNQQNDELYHYGRLRYEMAVNIYLAIAININLLDKDIYQEN